jgi:hypothetical protein
MHLGIHVLLTASWIKGDQSRDREAWSVRMGSWSVGGMVGQDGAMVGQDGTMVGQDGTMVGQDGAEGYSVYAL